MIKTLEENITFSNDYIKVYDNKVSFPNLSKGMYLRLVSPFDYGVFILAVNENDEVLLIEEYRYDLDSIILTVPKGNGENGVEPLIQAQKELKEEAGLVGDSWEEIMSVDEKIIKKGGAILFSTKVVSGSFDESQPEFSETILSSSFYSRNAIRSMLKNGVLRDPVTIIALQHWLLG